MPARTAATCRNAPIGPPRPGEIPGAAAQAPRDDGSAATRRSGGRGAGAGVGRSEPSFSVLRSLPGAGGRGPGAGGYA